MRRFRCQLLQPPQGAGAKLLTPSFLQSPPCSRAACHRDRPHAPRSAPLCPDTMGWEPGKAAARGARRPEDRPTHRSPMWHEGTARAGPKGWAGRWAELGAPDSGRGSRGCQPRPGALRGKPAGWRWGPVVITQPPQAVRAGMGVDGAAGRMGLGWGDAAAARVDPGTWGTCTGHQLL